MKKSKQVVSILAILWLVFAAVIPCRLFAEDKPFVARTVSGEAEFVILSEQEGQFDISQRGGLKQGDQLPTLCTVCIPEDSAIVLTDDKGKEIELYGPDVFDLWSLKSREYKKDTVKVQEGTVAIQNVITINGEMKAVGKPLLIPKGQGMVTDPCFHTLKFEFDTTDQAAAEAQAAAAVAAALSATSADAAVADLSIDETEESKVTSPSS